MLCNKNSTKKLRKQNSKQSQNSQAFGRGKKLTMQMLIVF